MKTRMLAMAAERGRVGARRAQACGFVSMIMVSRDGGGSGGERRISGLWVDIGGGNAACRQKSCCSGLIRRLRSW